MLTETWELSGQRNMKSMTEQAGCESCLSHCPHNDVGVARRRAAQRACARCVVIVLSG